MKNIRMLFVIVVTLTIAMGANAATINVPAGQPTIQAAINAANPAGGDTIVVAAGTYAEAIVINKPVILQGAGRDTTTIDATGASADTAVRIQQPGGSVTFDGFTVKSKGIAYPHWTDAMEVVSTTAASTITVTNSKFEGTGDSANYECGIYVHGTSAAFVFQHNIVTKGGGNPILVEKNPGATDVSYNTLDAGSYGMSCFYMTYGGTNVTTLQKFSNNTFDLGTGEMFDVDHAVHAVSFTGALWSTLGAGGYSNIEITNNRIYNGKAYCRGIGLFNDSTNGTDGLISGAVINNNIIEGIGAATASAGIRLGGLLTGITIQNNNISSMADGILGMVGPYGSHYPDSVTASNNNLVGNGLAANWPSAATQLNANNNWWGEPDGPGPVGPGSADRVSSNVSYSSWLTKPANDNVVYLEPTGGSIYVKPSETVIVDMKVANLQQRVTALQAMLNFSSTYFKTGPSDVTVAPGGGVWEELIYDVWNTGGDLDVAVGIDLESPTGTQADATTAIMTLTPTGTEGVTQMVFRADADPDPGLIQSTYMTDESSEAVWPAKVNSTNIYIDGTPPTDVTISADPVSWTKNSPVALTFSATDALSGIDHYELSLNGAGYFTATSPYNWDVSALATGTYPATVKAIDKAGNEATTSTTVYIDKTNPVASFTATQNSANVKTGSVSATTPVTLRGLVVITVNASDAEAGLLDTNPVTVAVAGVNTGAVTGSAGVYTCTATINSWTANGAHEITVTATDKAGNVQTLTDWIFVNKNQITGFVQLESFVGPSRVVTFVATGGTTKTWTQTLSFNGSVASFFLADVPEGTTGLSAKTAWNLRNKLAVTLVGGDAFASFTGIEKLLGGDINGSNSINILDYSILKVNWFTSNAVADINGDGVVNVLDYSLMKANWFNVGDPE